METLLAKRFAKLNIFYQIQNYFKRSYLSWNHLFQVQDKQFRILNFGSVQLKIGSVEFPGGIGEEI